MAQADYEIKPKKKFPVGWIIGGLAILLFGACGYAFLGIFKNIGVVKPINDDFIAEVLNDQFPPVASGIYSELGPFSDETIGPFNETIRTLGVPDEIGATNCSATSTASTTGDSGSFVDCGGPITYPIGAATLTMRWRKEGEDWKLYRFDMHFPDEEVYAQLVAELALAREEKAEKAKQKAEEP